MNRLFCGLIAAVLLSTVGACSKEGWKRLGYETLHNYSDRKNAGDPAYDSSERMSYDEYDQQRSLRLEQNEGAQER